MGIQVREYRQPLETGQGNDMNSLLETLEGNEDNKIKHHVGQ